MTKQPQQLIDTDTREGAPSGHDDSHGPGAAVTQKLAPRDLHANSADARRQERRRIHLSRGNTLKRKPKHPQNAGGVTEGSVDSSSCFSWTRNLFSRILSRKAKETSLPAAGSLFELESHTNTVENQRPVNTQQPRVDGRTIPSSPLMEDETALNLELQEAVTASGNTAALRSSFQSVAATKDGNDNNTIGETTISNSERLSGMRSSSNIMEEREERQVTRRENRKEQAEKHKHAQIETNSMIESTKVSSSLPVGGGGTLYQ